jgi:hypothetical protein
MLSRNERTYAHLNILKALMIPAAPVLPVAEQFEGII